MLTVLVE